MPAYLDRQHRLWIIHRKAASTSLCAMLGEYSEPTREEARELNLTAETITVVRHPWDRLVSALHSVLRSLAPLDERIEQHVAGFPPARMNSHIRPQSFDLAGMRIDELVLFEHLRERFPHLEHRRPGVHRPADWRAAAIDWARWYPVWRADFRLNPAWESLCRA